MPLRMTRSSPLPSSRVNFSSFLLFFTASQALTLTARKSERLKVSKSTKSAKSGSISTLEKSMGSGFTSCAGAGSGFFSALGISSGFMVGNRISGFCKVL